MEIFPRGKASITWKTSPEVALLMCRVHASPQQLSL